MIHYGTSHGLAATVGGGSCGPVGCSTSAQPRTTAGMVPAGYLPTRTVGIQITPGGGGVVTQQGPVQAGASQIPAQVPAQVAPSVVAPSAWGGTAQDFRFNKRLAQRDLQALLDKLAGATNFGSPGGTTLHRWEDRKDHGFMGDKPNRKEQLNRFGGHGVGVYDRTRLIDVGANQRVVLFKGSNFTGEQIGPLGPGSHRIPNVRSAIVLPATDIDALLNEATTMIQRLSTPEFGCLIDPATFQSGGFQNHPAIRGLDAFFNAVMQIVKGTPLEYEYMSKKNAAMQQLLTGVISNMQLCQQAAGGAAKPQAPAPIAQPQPQKPTAAQPQPQPAPSCPSGRMYYGVCVPTRIADCGSRPGEYFQARFNRNTGRANPDSIRCCIPGVGCVKQRGQSSVQRRVIASSSFSPLGSGGGGFGGGFGGAAAPMPMATPGYGGGWGGAYPTAMPGGFGGGFTTVHGPDGRAVAIDPNAMALPMANGLPVLAVTAQGIPLVPVVTTPYRG